MNILIIKIFEMKFIAFCVTLLILVHSETIVEEFENELISHIFPINDEDEAHTRYMQMMHSLMNFSKYFPKLYSTRGHQHLTY